MPFSLVDLLGGRVRRRVYSLMAFIVTVLAGRAVDEAGSARTQNISRRRHVSPATSKPGVTSLPLATRSG
jgi:hypothetical protein